MMTTTVLAYLDAGAGAMVAAAIASGAVGARALVGSAKDKLLRRRKEQAAATASPEPDRTTP